LAINEKKSKLEPGEKTTNTKQNIQALKSTKNKSSNTKIQQHKNKSTQIITQVW